MYTVILYDRRLVAKHSKSFATRQEAVRAAREQAAAGWYVELHHAGTVEII